MRARWKEIKYRRAAGGGPGSTLQRRRNYKSEPAALLREACEVRDCEPLIIMARLLGAVLVCAALSVVFIAPPRVEGTAGRAHFVGRRQTRDESHSKIHSKKEYINSWAVEIRGGARRADEVARRHGFKNLGEVYIAKYNS